MKTEVLGLSRLQLPILAYEFGSTNSPKVLILGGVHGDEVEGVVACRYLVQRFLHDFALKLKVKIIPEFNPEGVLAKTRQNSAGVDLNRNLPTKDWSGLATQPRYQPGPHPGSEPENQILINLLSTYKPHLIISLHSYLPMINVNGPCLPEAQKISEITGYKIVEEMGYSTPGCLGTYTGLERSLGTITYEIERGIKWEQIHDIHCPAIIEALKVAESRG